MKQCRKCKEEKELSEYYVHKEMLDGHLNICTKCTKARVNKHREANIEKIRAYDRNRAKLPHRIKMNTENTRKARKRNPLYNKAHLAVARAIKKGTLVRPIICNECIHIHNKIEGHHEDYSKPLEVVWLCPPCHRQLHLGKQEAL